MPSLSRIADRAEPTDPAQDRRPRPAPGRPTSSRPAPERLLEILEVLTLLLEYGRHLAETLEQRAVWRGFATIAQFFGTGSVPVITAHIHRGILRAIALQTVLRQRLARGRDLVIPQPRCQATRAASPHAQAAPAPTRARPDDRAFLRGLAYLPRMETLEAQARSRPVGSSIAAICTDLGISPRLCASGFWNRVFFAIHTYRGSLVRVMQDLRRREKQFDRDLWRFPTLELPEADRDAIQRVIGFLIGEPPAEPVNPGPSPLIAVHAIAAGRRPP